MSEPLRFKPVNPAHEMIYSTDGGWVSWEDYARLKAEVERLTAFTTRTIIPNEELQAENAMLKEEISEAAGHYNKIINDLEAQVERLTLAGDTIIHILCKYVPPTGAKYALMDWRDAKEGKGHA